MKVLESAMREIQASFHAKEERHADRADRLEAEVARLSRDDIEAMTATDPSVNFGWYNSVTVNVITNILVQLVEESTFHETETHPKHFHTSARR